MNVLISSTIMLVCGLFHTKIHPIALVSLGYFAGIITLLPHVIAN